MSFTQITIPASVDNNNVMRSHWRSKGFGGWLIALVFTAFYVAVYWFPETITWLIAPFDPLSETLRGKPADRWFMYGSFYTFGVLVFGVRMMKRYRHNRYHQIRTLSVMTVQLIFAYLLPAILVMADSKEFYFSYFWPLKPEYLFPHSFDVLFGSDNALLMFMGFWTIMMSFVAVPILTYKYGKRWYCSWVCGCGGLAETVGDPFRQNSDKSLRAWRIERWMIHSVLLFVIIVTVLMWLNAHWKGAIIGELTHPIERAYGFLIVAVFSGVVGVGFYPLMGSRVWCRFGCPQAAILGIIQRFSSRFRITTNNGQCISCGNCSTYCEMGIDVRWYAQRGEDIKRASCVGCGVCSAVCPRGVLKLENT
jgi:ferredoxin-type protein NapH